MITGDPAWFAGLDPWELRLWVCERCLDDMCCWCQAMSCRCACNDSSPAEVILADRVWRLADSVGQAPAEVPRGSVTEIQEARRAVLEADLRDAYGHLGEAARNGRAAA